MNSQYLWIVMLVSTSLTSCSSSTRQRDSLHTVLGEARDFKENSTSEPTAQKTCGLEIEYTLGRDRYELQLSSKDGTAAGTSLLNKHVLEYGSINPDRYQAYYQKVSAFLKTVKKSPSDPDKCRKPYSIVIHSPDGFHKVRGCKDNDGGSLSRLVKEGEFLLYSKM